MNTRPRRALKLNFCRDGFSWVQPYCSANTVLDSPVLRRVRSVFHPGVGGSAEAARATEERVSVPQHGNGTRFTEPHSLLLIQASLSLSSLSVQSSLILSLLSVQTSLSLGVRRLAKKEDRPWSAVRYLRVLQESIPVHSGTKLQRAFRSAFPASASWNTERHAIAITIIASSS